LNDDRATIIAKVRGWINPKLQIQDVSSPDLSPNDVVIHVKGKTDADYFGYQNSGRTPNACLLKKSRNIGQGS
jgi:hypothetical protein